MFTTNEVKAVPVVCASPVRITLIWDYEICNHRSASAFNRLLRVVERSPASWVVLDLSKCRYLSVSGLNNLLEWGNNLYMRGITLRVKGLSTMLTRMFSLSMLDWLILDED